ncbi:DUF551 domain-containing protein [Atlantibacter hermannii]|uniref:DUF551 domain-containing protein n=1 Tax=Atlantibacter hermannii TaxID=565 RepID=UPI002DB9380C|nr:DUF551 domain-containing protein [Atlantibacter hermannii]MEB7922379.1 DUF551 domain-containing protein [Atlantibacter hermannii]
MSAINERVSPKRLAEIIARAEVCDDSVLTDYRDIESIARELQQYRAAAEPMYQAKFSLGWRDVTKEQYDDNAAHGAPVRIVYAAPQVTSVPELVVWYGSMPESNGKTNWTAILYRKGEGIQDGFTIDRSEYPGRVLYAADRVRYLIGEVAERPYILNYDADEHSGYTAAPAVQAEPLSGNTEHVSQPTLREGLAAIRNLGPIDAEKIQAERDSLNEPDVPDGYALVPVELMESLRSSAHFEKQSYAASFGSHIDTGRWKVEYEELERVCKETDRIMAAAPQPQNVQQNNPENIPQWIPVSERMPESRHAVLVGCWFGSEWSSKWATFVPGHPDAQDSGWLIPGASWTPTHWHELPAAPKQEAE